MEIESQLDRIEKVVRDGPSQMLDSTRSHDITLTTFLKGYNLLNPASPLCINCENQMTTMHNRNKADYLQHRRHPCNVVKTIALPLKVLNSAWLNLLV